MYNLTEKYTTLEHLVTLFLPILKFLESSGPYFPENISLLPGIISIAANTIQYNEDCSNIIQFPHIT